MPELPDVTVYIEALDARISRARLERVRLASPFVLRSVDPPLADAGGRDVIGVSRLGKRILIALDGDLFLALHLMIAGRLHWKSAGARPPGKIGLAAFDFSTGTLTMTEAGTKRRASIHLLLVEFADGFLCFLVRTHFDEGEAPSATGGHVAHDANAVHFTGTAEEFGELIFCRGVRKVPDVESPAHLSLTPALGSPDQPRPTGGGSPPLV